MAKVATRTKTPDVAEALERMSKRLEELASQNEALVVQNLELTQRLAPVSRTSNVVDSGDLASAQNGVVSMPSTGPAMLVASDIVIPDGPPSKSKAEELAFMEEYVEVQLATSNDPNERQFVSVWNDGRHQGFVRGHWIKCKRKFIEVLARSKPETFGNEEYTDNQGVRQMRWPKQVANKYAFTVRDPNPRGQDWLRKVLAEAE